MSKMIKFAAIAAVALSLANCAANEEDRIKAWGSAQTRADTLKTTYPNFAKLIDAKKTEAKTAWDVAQKVTDKEKKIEALGAATLTLTKLTGRMAEVQSKSSAIRSDLKSLNSLKLAGANFDLRRATASNTVVALNNVDAAMANAAPTNEAEAMAVLDTQVSSLISTQGSVNSTMKAVKPKVKKKAKKKKKK